VFNVLLQVLDDGRLTDNHGNTVNFTNTIIVMTSNIGSELIQEIAQSGGDEEEMRGAVKQSLQTRFLPEFLNRIDEVMIFHPLKRSQIARIVEFQLKRLERQLQEQQFGLQVTEAACRAIADEGYDPTYGARPLKRVIQQRIQNPLATALLKGQIPEGGSVRIDFDGTDFTFQAVKAGESIVTTSAVV